MSYIYTYLTVAQKLVKEYTSPQPFHLYLKKYFSANKKHGSRDRKVISALCYSYFRLGKNFEVYPAEDKMLIGLSLCQPEFFNEKWQEYLTEKFPALGTDFNTKPLADKVQLAQQHLGFKPEELFSLKQHLSSLTNTEAFYISHLIQPNVWLRAKKNKKEKTEALLHDDGFEITGYPNVPNAIGISQQVNIEQVLGKNHHHLGEVQDASSQQTGNYIELEPMQKVWDCCCGAGGKSLMLFDIDTKIDLYCSDIRPQIVQNLKLRFKQSGLPEPQTAVADIADHPKDTLLFETKNERKKAEKEYFDTIVADVPCTGSGTWARTPEQGYFFEEEQIEAFAERQRNIVANAIPFLKKGGKLYYITCSVFKNENEEQLPHFEKLGLKTKLSEVIEGYTQRADNMFIAVLEKQ